MGTTPMLPCHISQLSEDERQQVGHFPRKSFWRTSSQKWALLRSKDMGSWSTTFMK